MTYSVNKDTKTIELHSGIISYDDIKVLVEQFEGFSFSVLAQKVEKQGMVVGANYIPITSTVEHN